MNEAAKRSWLLLFCRCVRRPRPPLTRICGCSERRRSGPGGGGVSRFAENKSVQRQSFDTKAGPNCIVPRSYRRRAVGLGLACDSVFFLVSQCVFTNPVVEGGSAQVDVADDRSVVPAATSVVCVVWPYARGLNILWSCCQVGFCSERRTSVHTKATP